MAEPVRTALLTGASRGIGLGIAERLAARRFGLTVAARDPDRLAAAASALRAAGAAGVVTVAGDVADASHLEELVDAHAAAYGTMSCLVLNAGVGSSGPIGDLPVRRLDKTVAVNFRAPYLLLQHALPLLRAGAAADPRHGARVVAVSSISGVHPESGLAAYGATKAALISLVETLNVEESAHGVLGTALAPGYVDTDMSAWVQGSVPPTSMIPVADLAALVDALVGLTARSVVPQIVVTRAGAPARGA